MSKKSDFTKKSQNIIRRGSSPISLEEFLNDGPLNDIKTQKETCSEDIYKREEFKFSYVLSKRLRIAFFTLKKTKEEIVQTALSEYLSKLIL